MTEAPELLPRPRLTGNTVNSTYTVFRGKFCRRAETQSRFGQTCVGQGIVGSFAANGPLLLLCALMINFNSHIRQKNISEWSDKRAFRCFEWVAV